MAENIAQRAAHDERGASCERHGHRGARHRRRRRRRPSRRRRDRTPPAARSSLESLPSRQRDQPAERAARACRCSSRRRRSSSSITRSTAWQMTDGSVRSDDPRRPARRGLRPQLRAPGSSGGVAPHESHASPRPPTGGTRIGRRSTPPDIHLDRIVGTVRLGPNTTLRSRRDRQGIRGRSRRRGAPLERRARRARQRRRRSARRRRDARRRARGSSRSPTRSTRST